MPQIIATNFQVDQNIRLMKKDNHLIIYIHSTFVCLGLNVMFRFPATVIGNMSGAKQRFNLGWFTSIKITLERLIVPEARIRDSPESRFLG